LEKISVACIFCPSTLDRHTKPEHILQNALGGRKTTSRVICSKCNNRFGGGIDKVLSGQFGPIRHLLQARSGDGGPPPIIKGVRSGDDIIELREGGRVRLANRPFTITVGPDGQRNLHISGESLAQIEAIVPNMAAALRVPEGQVRDLLSQTAMSVIERRPDPILLDIAFGGLKAVRSVAKCCLVLWANLVGNDEVNRANYDEVRGYINGENDDFHSSRTHLDSRIYDDIDRIKSSYGPVFNLLYVSSDGHGRVVGHLTL
jgi:hypothetical protein